MASGCSGKVVIDLGATSMIKPARPTKPHSMFLTALDIGFRWFHYNLTVFFYKLQDEDQEPDAFERRVQVLQASLSEALVAYYPWAGRLVLPRHGRLALLCNDAGVEFVQASTALPFSSLQKDDFQYKDFFKSFCTLTHLDEWIGHDLPLLSIQVTKFPRGEAMALGVSTCHVVADAISSFGFLKSWGEYARGLEMSVPPIHMREELCIEKLIKPSINKEGLSIAQGGKIVIERPNPGVLAQYDFHFSSQTLTKLKNIASGQKRCSTFEALVAHIWKHVGLAHDLKESDEFGLDIIGDFRSRLNPPLPQGYFGNVVMRSFTKAKIGDLRKESLRDTVKRVQDVIDTFNDRNFRMLVGACELSPAGEILESSYFKTPNLQISGSPKLPIYDVEFGWGHPSCVRAPCIRGDRETLMWMGKDKDGSIDVSIALSVPTMERLKEDTSFLFMWSRY